MDPDDALLDPEYEWWLDPPLAAMREELEHSTLPLDD